MVNFPERLNVELSRSPIFIALRGCRAATARLVSACLHTLPLGLMLAAVATPVTGATSFSADSVTVAHHVLGAESYRVAMVLPAQRHTPLPLILVQHGSSPTESFGTCPWLGSNKDCVKTDVFSKELVAQALQAGFAVAVIDAFSELGVSNRDKTQFPNATNYALHLRRILRSDARFDQSRIYYTGFSYGGASVLGVISRPTESFRAIAPVEAGCQFQPSGRRLPYPVLFVLGDRSHYPPKPCLYLQKALQDAGSDARAVVLEGADHNFGIGATRSGPSQSLNGCTDNAVIVEGRTWLHLNGQPTTREDAIRTCTTFVGFSSQDSTLLPKAVEHVVSFFKNH